SSCKPCTTGHSPAHSQTVAFHGAHCRITLGPAKLFHAELQRLNHVARRKWNIFSFINLRLVHQTKFYGVDLEPESKFVQRRFSCVKTRHRAGTAHVSSASDISLCAAKRHTQIRHAVMKWRCLTTVFVMRVEH